MSDMKSTLKGVVRDHRVPRDYKFHFAQPTGSEIWWKNLKRYLLVRQMTKQNVTTPMWMIFVSCLRKAPGSLMHFLREPPVNHVCTY